MDSIQAMCTGPFSVRGDAIRRKRQETQTVRKRALCAMVHNYIQTITVFKNLKKPQRRGSKFECGCCHAIVNQLENAHVGETLSTMVDNLMVEYPNESVENIYFKLLDLHESPDVVYVVCCKTCNKKLEQKLDGGGTDHLSHSE